jgi:hypothetical protein
VKWSTTAEILRNIDLVGITDGREINVPGFLLSLRALGSYEVSVHWFAFYKSEV